MPPRPHASMPVLPSRASMLVAIMHRGGRTRVVELLLLAEAGAAASCREDEDGTREKQEEAMGER
jgi:hypothetical protein